MDNDLAFQRRQFVVVTKMGSMCVRDTHVPGTAGNGVVERNHPTVKVIAERKRCIMAAAVFLHKLKTRDECSPFKTTHITGIPSNSRD